MFEVGTEDGIQIAKLHLFFIKNTGGSTLHSMAVPEKYKWLNIFLLQNNYLCRSGSKQLNLMEIVKNIIKS
jgi:hypothetical protein